MSQQRGLFDFVAQPTGAATNHKRRVMAQLSNQVVCPFRYKKPNVEAYKKTAPFPKTLNQQKILYKAPPNLIPTTILPSAQGHAQRPQTARGSYIAPAQNTPSRLSFHAQGRPRSSQVSSFGP